MTFVGDPYGILGLPRGASLDEVKRAYRRLAKRYHPDAAGPAATARFLAIQGAYEALAGDSGHAGGGRASRPTSAARPSQADPDRARSTREAYRAWRASAAPGRGEGASEASGGDAGTEDGPGAATGGRRASTGTGGRSSARPRRPPSEASGADPSGTRPKPGGPRAGSGGPRAGSGGRGPSSRRKATLRSTSYDDAQQEPRHPEWQGGSWYGTSSGTYWTINPREYADPRKHGPGYQARARRGAPAEGDMQGAGPPRAGHPSDGRPRSSDERPRSEAALGPEAPARPGWREPRGAGAPGPTPDGPPAGRDDDRDAIRGPSPIPTAGSIGLASGAVVAVPAAVVVLGSTMSGDLSLAALALAAPAVVALTVGLAVGLTRRPRA